MEVVSHKNFIELSNGEKPLVVDFWATWCGPCRMMAPNFEQVAEELSGDFIFGKSNVDDFSKFAGSQNIQSIPTIVVYKNGAEIARKMGFCAVLDLKTWLKTQK